MRKKGVMITIVIVIFLSSTYGCVQQDTETTSPTTAETSVITTETTVVEITEEAIQETTKDETEETSIEIDYCERDSDCVPKECCHPETCINNDNKDSCSEDQLCTTVCMPCISCSCINNKCHSETIEGCC